jgi:hypothetical protein
MRGNKEIPGTLSIPKVAKMFHITEATLIREARKIEPPIQTIKNRIVDTEIPRIQLKLEESKGRKK